MTTTTQQPAAPPARGARTEMTTAPGREPTPVRQRRRPALIGIGIALLALGPLAGAYIGANSDDSVPVLALATDKLAGQELSTADLRSVSISADPAQVPSIPVEDAGQVEGQLLTGNLPAGTVLTPQMLSEGPTTPTGTFIVGIPVTPGQLPAVGLRPGDQVTLVVGATQGATQQDPAGGEDSTARQLVDPGRTWEAEVVNVGAATEQDVTGAITVDVAIATGQATDVAAAAASRALSIVLQPAGASTEDGQDD